MARLVAIDYCPEMDEVWQRLAIALALGLLVGLERGWQGREEEEGHRVAGIRTFGLIGLLGAVWALLAEQYGALVLGIAYLGFAAAVTSAYILGAHSDRGYGITTVVAALLTFALGALAIQGYTAIAAAATVVMTTLLGMKPILHRWLTQLEQRELFATLKLLLISVVLLPILPNSGYGPSGALNPYVIWWLVVLIAGISFVGYFAIKIAGTRIGIFLTGIFGGLASSTALTLDLSRLGKRNRGIHALLAAGVVVAATTMFPRVLIEVAVVNPGLLDALVAPLAAMSAAGYGFVLWTWFSEKRRTQQQPIRLQNPFELLPALKFGALLVAVMLAAKFAQLWFGDVGIYVTAALSGIADVDAITLSLARLSRDGLAPEVAVRGIIIASVVNTFVKVGLVAGICGGRMAMRVALMLGVTVLVGLVVLFTTT
ncbi:MgtC/SapB family protein [Thiohalomonas denitrificans]|uniref:MgtC/SapB family protein n=1 Tax=Thiohalomonas denitrificans TaxID=415747 RepID=UPI001FDFA601|nr:MgtC/SapB family protein [Thiohalomonas denitrificans]